MRIGLLQVDGKIPNLALMKLSAWHKSNGDSVELADAMFGQYDRLYRSKVFTYTDDDSMFWNATEIVSGGTGYDIHATLPEHVENCIPDYDLFGLDHAIGFTSRGCIRKCKFCVVPEKEGSIRVVGDLRSFTLPHHKWAMLLDNNLTAIPEHLEVIMRQSRDMNVAVDITQAMDARLVTDEVAKLIAHGKHKASIRFSMDNPEQDERVIKGIERVVRAGITRSRIMVFVLVGAPWLDFDSTVERISMLRGLGYRPFAMPYKALDGSFDASKDVPVVKHLARWTNRQELVGVSWSDYKATIGRAASVKNLSDVREYVGAS